MVIAEASISTPATSIGAAAFGLNAASLNADCYFTESRIVVAVYKAPLIYWVIGLALPAVVVNALSNAPLALSPTH
jgi:hypothetical protein